MEILKALELVSAPQSVRFNILAFENWRNKKDRKIRLVELVEFLNDCLKTAKTNLQIEQSKLQFSRDMAQRAVANLEKMGNLLPIHHTGKMTLEDARNACTLAYEAGLSEGVRLGAIDTEEDKKAKEYSEALAIVHKEIDRIQAWVNANKLVVDGKIVEAY